MSEITDIFQELMYGSGGWLMILLFLTLIILVGWKNKYLAILLIPFSLLLGFSYLQNVDPASDLMWGSILMFLATVFLGLRLTRDD